MRIGTSIVIFFLAIIALVAEFVLYFFVGIGAAFSGNVHSLSGTALFFVSLMVLTAATGILSPICAVIELVSKKQNLGLYVLLPTLGLVLVGLIIYGATMSSILDESKPAATSASLTPGAATSTGWRVTEETSPMDSSKTVTLFLDSEGEIQGWLESKHPTLIVRCKEKQTDAYILTGMAANPEYGEETFTVRLRFDDAKPVTEHWSKSTDDTALFSGSPRQFAKHLTKTRALTFEFTPFNASPAVAHFNVQGLEVPLKKVADACGWAF